MAEDKNSEENTELQQEEYHYSDPDSPSENYTEEPEKKMTGFMGGGYRIDDRRKRIIVILVILGLIFVVLQFVKAKNKTEKASEATPISNIEKAVEEQSVQQDKALSSPEPALPSPAPAPAATTPELAPKTPEPIPEVKTQDLESSINNLETNVKHLTESVDLLQTQVQDLLKKPTPVIKPKAIKREAKHKEVGYKIGMRSRHNKSGIYYVKAVVPRRAWLEKENGEILTVQTDDRIPGYGRVQSIDASEGIVTTSSNKIIRFSANDN
jgi:intracellular multiplication protein IcmG